MWNQQLSLNTIVFGNGPCWLEVVHSHACHPNNHSVPCGALKVVRHWWVVHGGGSIHASSPKSPLQFNTTNPQNENKNKNHRVVNVTGLSYACQQNFEFMYAITSFKPITMFSGTDNILQNIPQFNVNVENIP